MALVCPPPSARLAHAAGAAVAKSYIGQTAAVTSTPSQCRTLGGVAGRCTWVVCHVSSWNGPCVCIDLTYRQLIPYPQCEHARRNVHNETSQDSIPATPMRHRATRSAALHTAPSSCRAASMGIARHGGAITPYPCVRLGSGAQQHGENRIPATRRNQRCTAAQERPVPLCPRSPRCVP